MWWVRTTISRKQTGNSNSWWLDVVFQPCALLRILHRRYRFVVWPPCAELLLVCLLPPLRIIVVSTSPCSNICDPTLRGCLCCYSSIIISFYFIFRQSLKTTTASPFGFVRFSIPKDLKIGWAPDRKRAVFKFPEIKERPVFGPSPSSFFNSAK